MKQIFNQWTTIFDQKLSLNSYAKICLTTFYHEYDQLYKIFDIEADMAYSFAQFFETAFDLDPLSFIYVNETTISSLYNNLIFNVLKKMIESQKLSLRVSLDCAMINAIHDSQASSISTSSSKSSFNAIDVTTKKQNNKALMRPDLWVADQYGRILLKGEHKSKNFHAGTSQLDSYGFDLDPIFYKNINATFGYVAAKADIAFYFFDHQNKSTACTVENMISKYDLTEITDRIKLVVNVISLSFVCRFISTEAPPSDFIVNLGQWQPQRNNKSCIMYCIGNVFMKQVQINDQITPFSGPHGLNDLNK